MDYSKIRIPLEEILSKELYETLEGSIIENLIKEAKIEKFENQWKFILEGHSFKVNRDMAPRLHNLFEEVKQKIGFSEETEFYVTNDSEVNAFAISRVEDDQPHLINLNSGLIEKLDDDELKFTLGHEIGHLISKNANIDRIIQFIFPKSEKLPLILFHKIKLWEKLKELSADRYGFIASPNIEKCVSGFFKLASGLDTERLHFDYQAYLIENEERLKYFRESKAVNLLSHPINPLRIKAIQLFSNSATFKNIKDGSILLEDEVLIKQIEEITEILLTISSSELDVERLYFIASSGLIMARVDREMNADELEHILKILSIYTIFPKNFLSKIIELDKPMDIFMQSAERIINQNPGERYMMFDYMINVALSDNEIFGDEISFLYEVGEKMFGFSKKETAQQIAEVVKNGFIPKLYNT
jgi:hypothetical protein